MEKKFINKILIAFCLISTVLISCSSDPAVQYTYKSPEGIDDGINVGTLDDVNMDVTLLKDGVKKIYAGNYQISPLLEEYFYSQPDIRKEILPGFFEVDDYEV